MTSSGMVGVNCPSVSASSASSSPETRAGGRSGGACAPAAEARPESVACETEDAAAAASASAAVRFWLMAASGRCEARERGRRGERHRRAVGTATNCPHCRPPTIPLDVLRQTRAAHHHSRVPALQQRMEGQGWTPPRKGAEATRRFLPDLTRFVGVFAKAAGRHVLWRLVLYLTGQLNGQMTNRLLLRVKRSMQCV